MCRGDRRGRRGEGAIGSGAKGGQDGVTWCGRKCCVAESVGESVGTRDRGERMGRVGKVGWCLCSKLGLVH